jgi:LysM repeat protein
MRLPILTGGVLGLVLLVGLVVGGAGALSSISASSSSAASSTSVVRGAGGDSDGSGSSSTSAPRTTSVRGEDGVPGEDHPLGGEGPSGGETTTGSNPPAQGATTTSHTSTPDRGSDQDGDVPGQGRVLRDDDVHLVQHGDTLSSISTEYGISVDMLAEYNGIADVDLIYRDSSLLVPYSELLIPPHDAGGL